MASIPERLNPVPVVKSNGEKLGRFMSRRVLIRSLTGADSTEYVRLQSVPRPEIDPDSIDWTTIEHDEEAGRMPRHRRHVAILAMPVSGFQELTGNDEDADTEAQLPADALQRPGRIKDAVAWLNDQGTVRVATRPDDIGLLRGFRIDDEPMLAIARRQTPEDVEATLGFWIPAEERFVAAPEVEVVRASVDIADIGSEPYQHLSVI